MSREKSNMGISVGSSSILAIFVVLCLTTFATLSLVSARADYKLTQKTAQSTSEYYAADTKAEELLQQLHQALLHTDAWREQLSLIDASITYEKVSDGYIFRYDIPVNDHKTLHVELIAAVEPDGSPASELRRLRWKVQPEQSWQDETQINLPGISDLPIFRQKG